ncbi:MAG: nickel-dependent hydrogenase large subunit [Halobacteriota archaeon]
MVVTYEIKTGGGWKTVTAKDVPKHDGSAEGQIRGEGLEDTSKVVYESGGANPAGHVELNFKYNYDYPTYTDWIRNVNVTYYGYAGEHAVPTPDTWDTAAMGYGADSQSDQPNPLNILRTIRSYDPCLACSIHVIDKKGKNIGKYEAVPMAGWDPK